MAERKVRYRTGSSDLDSLIDELLDAAGATAHRGLLFEILVSAVRLARDNVDPLDLKITNAALKEMRNAFRTFQPYRNVPKVAVFGSARTREDDPLYAQARDVASALAGEGWMVVTGAGPGIMAAAMEGAGREHSLGVSIRLPFEQQTNPTIAADGKLVSMKYFFTRKLMLVKESKAFVCLPGGFGTLDETFELLTLTQTGKGSPVPIVFLDIPGGTYWERCREFIQSELVSRALVTPDDLNLFLVTDDVERAQGRDLRLLRQLRLDAVRRGPPRDPAAGTPRPSSSWPTSSGASATWRSEEGSWPPHRSPRRSPTTTASTSPGSCWTSTSDAPACSAPSSTPSTTWLRPARSGQHLASST